MRTEYRQLPSKQLICIDHCPRRDAAENLLLISPVVSLKGIIERHYPFRVCTPESTTIYFKPGSSIYLATIFSVGSHMKSNPGTNAVITTPAQRMNATPALPPASSE